MVFLVCLRSILLSVLIVRVVAITDAKDAVKVWDVRAKSIVYELATGNDEVVGLGWDDTRSTICDSRLRQYDTNGRTYGLSTR